MEGLLNSIEMNSHSSPTSSPSAAHEHHMTVGQISRDFSSVSSSGHDRGDTVAFLVGKTMATFFICYFRKTIISYVVS